LEPEGPLGRLVAIPSLRAILPLEVERAILRAKAILVAVVVAVCPVARHCSLLLHPAAMVIPVLPMVAVAQAASLRAVVMKVALHTRVHCLAMIMLEVEAWTKPLLAQQLTVAAALPTQIRGKPMQAAMASWLFVIFTNNGPLLQLR